MNVSINESGAKLQKIQELKNIYIKFKTETLDKNQKEKSTRKSNLCYFVSIKSKKNICFKWKSNFHPGKICYILS